MQRLEKNINNAFGEVGSEWLRTLPTIIQQLAYHWSLINIQPIKNMSWNYVAFATQQSNPVMLKISCDKQLIQDEYRTLKHLNGHGAIKVIDISHEYNAMLLEQAIPGYLLKAHHPFKVEDTIKIYSQVVKAISSCTPNDFSYTHVSTWCEAIDKIQDARVGYRLVEKAKKLKLTLLQSAKNEYLCHGDLHLENIIQHGLSWLAIDPKGIIGEIAFEAAAFDLISPEEMQETSIISTKITERVHLLSTALDIDFDRLLSWIYLRIMLSAQWFIEDNGDPSHMLDLAKYVYPLLT